MPMLRIVLSAHQVIIPHCHQRPGVTPTPWLDPSHHPPLYSSYYRAIHFETLELFSQFQICYCTDYVTILATNHCGPSSSLWLHRRAAETVPGTQVLRGALASCGLRATPVRSRQAGAPQMGQGDRRKVVARGSMMKTCTLKY